MLDQPAGRHQAPPGPPRADHAEVDVGAVACDDIAKALLMSKRQCREVLQGIAMSCLGPIDHAGDLVTVDEHVGDLPVATHEHWCVQGRRAASAIRRLRVTSR